MSACRCSKVACTPACRRRSERRLRNRCLEVMAMGAQVAAIPGRPTTFHEAFFLVRRDACHERPTHRHARPRRRWQRHLPTRLPQRRDLCRDQVEGRGGRAHRRMTATWLRPTAAGTIAGLGYTSRKVRNNVSQALAGYPSFVVQEVGRRRHANTTGTSTQGQSPLEHRRCFRGIRVQVRGTVNREQIAGKHKMTTADHRTLADYIGTALFTSAS